MTTRSRISRPVLLLLVYGALAFIVAGAAIAQSVLVSAHVSAATINTVVESDSGTVAAFMNSYLAPADLEPGAMSESRRGELEQGLAVLARRSGFLRVEVRDPAGAIVLSDVSGLAGTVVARSPAFVEATEGRTSAAITEGPLRVDAAGPALAADAILGEYLPLMAGDRAAAVVAVWRDAERMLGEIEAARRDVLIATLSAAFIAAAVLYLVFRSAQSRLSRQSRELLEATRRDPLTGLLNHGALVELLGENVETARRSGTCLAIAHVDIDGFRLLNDNHGHDAGEDAVREVAAVLRGHASGDMIVGRHGPDEFLVIAPGLVSLEPLVADLRATLLERSLQFGSTERLPITVSVGLAAFPANADNVTALLSTAGVALGRAKSAGGDAVRTAETPSGEDAATRTFDVLQGLVFAIDSKDRYTKRHSEEVARYSAFLADRLDLDEETRSAIWTAGLLHDVGKIGLPDALLRKPGPLSAEEYEIVKQHVALGDSIVRTLPNADLARAGIRHHHERLDGSGYLERLRGDEIPLIARILAVGDAFSAMTTTRPYRKALTVEEALRRLGDSAGHALDERLVTEFIAGIETAEHPPLPGVPTSVGATWLRLGVAR